MNYYIRRTWSFFENKPEYRYDTLEETIRHNWSAMYAEGWETRVRIYTTWDCQPVEVYKIEEIRNCIINENYGRRYGPRNYKFRDGPVPNIRICRRGGWWRKPKTKQELSVEYPTRAKRKNLPTAWDERWMRNERNWKSFRKTQYKET